MPRFLMKLSYDGTNFLGWQVQKQNRTVQLILDNALSEFCGYRVKATGSGRTDTGVHALGQHAHFDYNGNATPEQIKRGLRRHLPDDVQILSIHHTTTDFHARYDAYERHYQYIISLIPTPFNRLYTGSFPRKKLRPDYMSEVSRYFTGEHDFTSFSKDNPAVPDHVCTVKESRLEIAEDTLIFTIVADRFLHNMVRRIVGAMVSVGHHQLEPSIILKWLDEKQSRQTMIFPAPPQGLYLMDVKYPENKIIQ
jgi:tRNA pseudouridine38-40 synthase